MMSMKLIGSLSCCLWLVMAIATVAQTSDDSNAPVLDTSGQALQVGVEYYIKPAITDNGGRFTLINRNDSCPLYVGQENVSGPEGYPVTFAPFVEGETVSTAWKLGETDEVTQRRLIVTGEDQNQGIAGPARNYFRVNKQAAPEGVYNLEWCPTELCPTCRFICGSAGALVENGKRLIALDGSVLPVVFERA
ncbi:alpha-amylase/subtilisin inhibitor-like [Prunus yedoensis var. nudiflora]|uniref:Alpha-amylase/subtilisin inhibitor-like n=1 Tax=Prunus yedoensis var. nudiflora TaxID=2094558 RepID=A0A314ZAK3_PRUYE|nr:alpha-amylase/subtilisin inhibitor-like [Prunus yedoensis var. nudiflora]